MLATEERSPRSWMCILAHGGHVEYANYVIFELNQNNPTDIIQKKNCEDQVNLGEWRAFT